MVNLANLNIDLRNFEYPSPIVDFEDEILSFSPDDVWAWSPTWKPGVEDDYKDLSPLTVLIPSGMKMNDLNVDTYAGLIAKRMAFHIDQFCLDPSGIIITDPTPRRIFVETVKQLVCDRYLVRFGAVDLADSIKDMIELPDTDSLDIALAMVSAEEIYGIISNRFSDPIEDLLTQKSESIRDVFEELNDVSLDAFLSDLIAL